MTPRTKFDCHICFPPPSVVSFLLGAQLSKLLAPQGEFTRQQEVVRGELHGLEKTEELVRDLGIILQEVGHALFTLSEMC